MKLSMIVVITSCAPHFARSTPGTKPTAPPAHSARDGAQRHRDERRRCPREARDPPAPHANPPAASCPSAPMLNSPARNPIGDGEPGADERRRLVEHLPEAVRVSPRALEHQPVHGAGRLPDGEDEQIAGDDRRPAAQRAAEAAPRSS